MAQDLSANFAKSISAPPKGNRVYYDAEVQGFGLRITAAGAKSFVLNYRTRSGRERRYTIGACPEENIAVAIKRARKAAAELKEQVRGGADPLGEIEADRGAPTIERLCERFIEQHVSRKRPSTQEAYEAAVEIILDEWRHRKVSEIDFSAVDALHRKITKYGTRDGHGRGAPYRANRVVAVISKMFSLAIRLKWCTTNPTKGIERNPEEKRRRYLQIDELEALVTTLSERNKQGKTADKRSRDRASDIIRLLLLTGARRGEVLSMKWGDVDLTKGQWDKPGHTTKQRTEHSIPLSAPARQLLAEVRKSLKDAPDEDEPVFPGRGTDAPQSTLKKSWRAITARATVLLLGGDAKSPAGKLIQELRKGLRREPTLKDLQTAATAAKIKLPIGLQDFRLHDLRHSYASFLVSEGLSLPTIGALLGHTQPSTTNRYAHLFDDPMRKATERVGEIVAGTSGKPRAGIVSLKGAV